jgi:hypothetical protein
MVHGDKEASLDWKEPAPHIEQWLPARSSM